MTAEARKTETARTVRRGQGDRRGPGTQVAADVTAFATQTISVMGRKLVADQAGVLYLPGENVLIVSDLHLEKGSSRAARGSLLPPYDTRETLLRLARVIDAYAPDTVVSLGDSFHDAGGPARLGEDDLAILTMLQEDRDWVWITGNHDPEISSRVGGMVTETMTIGGLTLRHEPLETPTTHEIAGHLHPAARLAVRGTALRRACFLGNGQRLIMPAFGAFTGGLNVLDEAFAPLFGGTGFSVWMRGAEGLYPVSTRRLLPDSY